MLSVSVKAQDDNNESLNPVRATVPFVTIAPDARSAGMGDIGASTSPDINSQYWNAAKYTFIPDRLGFALSYTPWLSGLGPGVDINLLNLTGFYKFDDRQTLSSSIRYFDLGQIDARDNNGVQIMTIKPNEFAFDVAYGRKLSENLSAALTLKLIYSDIAGGLGALSGSVEFGRYKAGVSFGADLSTYYNKEVNISGYTGEYALGVVISNISSKMSYNEGGDKEFVPTNLRVGNRFSLDIDDYNTIGAAFEINKLMVPTFDDSIDYQAINTIEGMGRSFYDAPGYYWEDKDKDVSSMGEELQEIMWSIGLEYWYQKQFAIRTGYFHEHQNKGNRKFFTAGIGIKLNVVDIDVSYLIPASAGGANNPLAKTYRIGLGFNFE